MQFVRAPAQAAQLLGGLRAGSPAWQSALSRAPASGRRRAPGVRAAKPPPRSPWRAPEAARRRRHRRCRRSASTARSSICAGRISKRRPTAASILPRTSLFDASTSGCGLSQSGMMVFLDPRVMRTPQAGFASAASALSRHRLAAAFAQQPHHRGGGFLDRTTRHIDRRPVISWLQSRREKATSSATAALSIYRSSSRCAFRPSSRFSRICTMRSGLA